MNAQLCSFPPEATAMLTSTDSKQCAGSRAATRGSRSSIINVHQVTNFVMTMIRDTG